VVVERDDRHGGVVRLGDARHHESRENGRYEQANEHESSVFR
jgi:hypothetical protein